MPFKKNGRPAYFLTAHLKPFWSSKITSLEELKERMSNHVLVGFDMEGYHGNTSEIGLAMLATSGTTPHAYLNRRQFSDGNCIQAFTIDIQKRWKKNSEPKKHTQITSVDDELQAGPACEKILAGFRDLGPFILVGYDLSTEFKWISEKYPAFASHFSALLDVQELVGRGGSGPFLGLTNALHGLGIVDNRHNYHYHSAANDAVRSLAILAHLLSGAKLAFKSPSNKDEVKRWSSLPHLRQCGPRTNHPFSARVSTTDGDALPALSLKELANLYASYNLKAVAMNCNNQQRGKIWWLAFHTLESLKDFLRDFEGTLIEGRSLKVILAIGIEDAS